MFRKNVAGQFIHVQGVDAATGGIKSGVAWTVRRCIDGTFAAATGTVTEDGTTGWYKFALSQADTNGNDIGFNFTGTGAVPQTASIVTTAADPTNASNLGLTDVTAIKTQTDKLAFTVANQVDANTLSLAAALRPGIRKNTALPAFEFLMTDSTAHNPATGKAVAVTRSLDGGAFLAGALSAVVEIGVGMYAVDFAAGDLNGNVITLRATATGCDDTFVTIKTSP